MIFFLVIIVSIHCCSSNQYGYNCSFLIPSNSRHILSSQSIPHGCLNYEKVNIIQIEYNVRLDVYMNTTYKLKHEYEDECYGLVKGLFNITESKFMFCKFVVNNGYIEYLEYYFEYQKDVDESDYPYMIEVKVIGEDNMFVNVSIDVEKEEEDGYTFNKDLIGELLRDVYITIHWFIRVDLLFDECERYKVDDDLFLVIIVFYSSLLVLIIVICGCRLLICYCYCTLKKDKDFEKKTIEKDQRLSNIKIEDTEAGDIDSLAQNMFVESGKKSRRSKKAKRKEKRKSNKGHGKQKSIHEILKDETKKDIKTHKKEKSMHEILKDETDNDIVNKNHENVIKSDIASSPQNISISKKKGKGFESVGLSEDWQKMFNDAGISKDEYSNPEVARSMMNAIYLFSKRGQKQPKLFGKRKLLKKRPSSLVNNDEIKNSEQLDQKDDVQLLQIKKKKRKKKRKKKKNKRKMKNKKDNINATMPPKTLDSIKKENRLSWKPKNNKFEFKKQKHKTWVPKDMKNSKKQLDSLLSDFDKESKGIPERRKSLLEEIEEDFENQRDKEEKKRLQKKRKLKKMKEIKKLEEEKKRLEEEQKRLFNEGKKIEKDKKLMKEKSKKFENDFSIRKKKWKEEVLKEREKEKSGIFDEEDDQEETIVVDKLPSSDEDDSDEESKTGGGVRAVSIQLKKNFNNTSSESDESEYEEEDLPDSPSVFSPTEFVKSEFEDDLYLEENDDDYDDPFEIIPTNIKELKKRMKNLNSRQVKHLNDVDQIALSPVALSSKAKSDLTDLLRTAINNQSSIK